MEIFLISLAVIVLGGVLCFSGYQLYRVLIPIWGFFVGFSWGAQIIASGSNTGFLATILGWAVGIGIGLVFAALAYMFYQVAVAILVGSIGFWFTGAVLLGIGFNSGFLVTFLAISVGIILAAVAVYYNAPKGLLILLSAFAGATAIIGGTLLLFGVVPVAVLGTNMVSLIIQQSFWWSVVWLALTAFGIVTQMQISRSVLTDESAYTSMYPTTMTGAKGGQATKKEKH